jgi:hypothetical protein
MKCKHKNGYECYLMKCENCKVFKQANQQTLNLYTSTCTRCTEQEQQPNIEAWKYVTCIICGAKPQSKNEIYKWIEGVCLTCQKQYLNH